jgi:nucleoside-diphosphate-sugar epimerase
MRIFVMGGGGLIGSEIVTFFRKYHQVHILNKKNYKLYSNKKCDLFINANGNSSRYLGNKYPYLDFIRSVQTTYKSIKDFKFKKYIFLSSIEVYVANDKKKNKNEKTKIKVDNINHYGFNKFLSENIVKHFCKNYLILRLGPVVSNKMKKNHIYDILNKKKIVHVNSESQSTFVSSNVVVEIIFKLLKKKINGIINISAINSLNFKNIDKLLSSKSNFDSSIRKFNNSVNTKIIENFFDKNRLRTEYAIKKIF